MTNLFKSSFGLLRTSLSDARVEQMKLDNVFGLPSFGQNSRHQTSRMTTPLRLIFFDKGKIIKHKFNNYKFKHLKQRQLAVTMEWGPNHKVSNYGQN